MHARIRTPLILAGWFFTLALLAGGADAAQFSLSLGDVEAVPDGSCSVPIYAYATEGNVRFVKVVIEYDHAAYTFEGFTSNVSGGYFDTNDDLPFGVCGDNVTENALAMWSGVDLGTGGLIGWANFTALDEWSTYSAPVRLDCFCGQGVSHLEMWTYATTSPFGPIDAVFNRCDEDFTVLDGSITIVSSKPRGPDTAVRATTWGAVKQLMR